VRGVCEDFCEVSDLKFTTADLPNARRICHVAREQIPVKQTPSGTQLIRGRLWQAAKILLALYLLACIGCAAFQRTLLSYPTNDSAAAMDRAGKSRGLERWKNVAGENIGWKRMATRQPVVGQILITHGNGGCAVDRADFMSPLLESTAMDIFILEYPGFGDRAGTPSQTSLFTAAENAYQSMPKTAPVYLIGESLGTGVAAFLAGKHSNEVAGVLLFAPYNSLVDVAQYHVRLLPARWLMHDYFESGNFLKPYRGPVAIFVGGKDAVIPKRYAQRLYDSYTGPKRLWEIPQAGHNTIHGQVKEQWKEVADFWRMNTSPVARPN